MNILTFDIEEWFHLLDHEGLKKEENWSNFEYRLESNVDRILELLCRKNQKATFFCLGWVARRFPKVIKKIQTNFFEIGSHSDVHKLVYEQNRNQFRDDLKKSLASIEDVTGVKCTSYRAPGFSIKDENKWVFKELINQGIKIDCSIFPAKRAHGGFESFTKSEPCLINFGNKSIKEFPINVFNFLNYPLIFSGGGYFRMLPYKFIRQLVKKSDYVMTYFHPRDFDENQPIISDLSIIRKYKSYVGLKYSFKNLEKLISEFEFIDLRNADRFIDWDKKAKIDFS